LIIALKIPPHFKRRYTTCQKLRLQGTLQGNAATRLV